MMDRQQHLDWAKERALAYVELGELQQAFTSMAADLRLHPELADHPGLELGLALLLIGDVTPQEMREHITGYH